MRFEFRIDKLTLSIWPYNASIELHDKGQEVEVSLEQLHGVLRSLALRKLRQEQPKPQPPSDSN